MLLVQPYHGAIGPPACSDSHASSRREMPDAPAVEQLSFGSNSPDDRLPMTRCLASGVRAPTASRAGGCSMSMRDAATASLGDC